MFDPEHLSAIMDFRGMSRAEVARRTGDDQHPPICRQEIGKLLKGQVKEPSNSQIARIARALRVQPGVFDDAVATGDDWRPITWRQVERVRALFEEIRSADTLITCTKGMPAHLECRVAHDWAFERAHTAAGWTAPAIQSALQKVFLSGNRDIDGIKKGKCKQRIIAPEWRIRQSFAQEPDWVEGTRAVLRDFEGKSVLGLVPDQAWPTVERKITRALEELVGPGADWDVVMVGLMNPLRPVIAVVRPRRDTYWVTHHPTYLDTLLHAILSVRLDVPDHGSILTLPPYHIPSVRASASKSIARLNTIALEAQKNRSRETSDAERRAIDLSWARLALPPEPLKAGLN